MKNNLTIIRTQWILWIFSSSALIASYLLTSSSTVHIWEGVSLLIFCTVCIIDIHSSSHSSLLSLARYSLGSMLALIGIYFVSDVPETPSIIPLCVTLALLLANEWKENQSQKQMRLRFLSIAVLVVSYVVSQLDDSSWFSSSFFSLGLIYTVGFGYRILSVEPAVPHERVGSDNIVRVGEYKDTKTHWYYALMQSSWLELSVKLTLGYFAFCFAFALLYMFDPNALNAELSWTEALAFSVQTFSTIGYGALYPNSEFAHTIVFIESFAGIGYVAVVTGLIFAKVSHPVTHILFSNKVIFHTFNECPTLSFRLANPLGTNIVDAKVSLYLLRTETNKEGLELNRIYDLALLRNHSPLFALSWNLFHPIDEQSPLFGMSKQDIEENIIYFIVTVQGHEQTYNQQIYDRHTYRPDVYAWDKKFVDVVTRNEFDQIVLSLTHFHDTVHSDPYWLSAQENT